MKNILFTCMGRRDKDYKEALVMLLEESDSYKKDKKLDIEIVKEKEREYIEYLIKSFESSKETPSEALFVLNFPEAVGVFSQAVEIPVNDLRVYIYQLIDSRVNRYVSLRLAELNKIVAVQGITKEIMDELTVLNAISNRNKAREVELDINIRSVYEEKKTKPNGMITGIKSIDEKIGGMNYGTVTTIAGFTSQYKTTFALNIARINSYYLGYNIAYISLETPKEDMLWNLLSCHSYEPHLSKYDFVGHDKMRQCKMTPEEESFIFDEVLPDLSSTYTDERGNTRERGRVIFLDESDFDTFSFGEISNVIANVDKKLGGKLDAVIVDYVQLCKFSGGGFTNDANSQINSYVTFFRRLGQNFKKEKNAQGEEHTRMLTMILLSQINRDNWRRAKNNEGRYDLTCLADANELERGSFRVFTTYTNEDLKGRKSAQVQILKNRTGQTMYDPSVVYADGESYVFMDEDGMTQTFGGDQTLSIDSAFAGLGGDLGFLGI